MKFWKDNKTDNEFELTHEEVLSRFYKWVNAGEGCATWSLDRNVRVFLTAREINLGVQSVFDEDEYEDFFEVLRQDGKWRDIY